MKLTQEQLTKAIEELISNSNQTRRLDDKPIQLAPSFSVGTTITFIIIAVFVALSTGFIGLNTKLNSDKIELQKNYVNSRIEEININIKSGFENIKNDQIELMKKIKEKNMITMEQFNQLKQRMTDYEYVVNRLSTKLKDVE